jgi:hypothetical protein
MFSLFRRARAYSSLTPAERALLKLLEGLACAALVAALPIVATALAQGTVNWPDVARAALAAGAVAILLAFAKYAKAHGDPTLSDLMNAAAQEVASSSGASTGRPPAGDQPPSNGVSNV